MAKCLRCGAGPEWIQGNVPNEPAPECGIEGRIASTNVRCSLPQGHGGEHMGDDEDHREWKWSQKPGGSNG